MSEKFIPAGSPTADVEEVKDSSIFRSLAVGEHSYTMRSPESPVTYVRNRRIYGDTQQPDDLAGALVDNAVLNDIPLPTGVIALFGGANSSKSPLAHYICAKADGKLIRYGEPLPGYHRDFRLAVNEMFTTDKKVIVLDSVKNLIGRIEGGLMTTGISREFFAMLSDWSSYFAELGKTLVVIINATTKDENVLDMVVEGLFSNTTGVLYSRKGSIEWKMRAGSGKQRREGEHTIIWQGDGVISRLQVLSTNITKPRGPVPSRQVIPTSDVGATEIVSPLARGLSRVARSASSNR